MFFNIISLILVVHENLIFLCPHLMSFLSTETLPWRRTSDLHVMLSVAVVAMLGWSLDKERLWELFHQEEGRYVSAAPAETETTIKSPEFCWKSVTC